MAVDLHTHSTASDGTDSPAGVVAGAVSVGLSAVALTDHDTLSGIEEARDAAAGAGIELVPGTELSVRSTIGKVHLLVYFLEPRPGPLQDRLAWLRRGRNERNAAMVERLRGLGYEITLEEVEGHARGDSIGRPHIADALVTRGYFTDRTEAFEAVLGDGRPGYLPRFGLEAEEAIRLAKESGAVTSIAHPYTIAIDRAGYRTAFRSLAAAGLDAIESHHAEHSSELRAHLASIAADLGLATTGGSDYHGAGKRGVAIGVGKGDLSVPDEVLERLRDLR